MKPQVLGQDHSTGPNIHSILKMQDLKRNFLYAVNNMLEVRIFIQQLLSAWHWHPLQKWQFPVLQFTSYGWGSEVKVAQPCLTLQPLDYSPWNCPGQNTGVGSLSLLQWIFPTQELNQALLYCRWILLQTEPSPLGWRRGNIKLYCNVINFFFPFFVISILHNSLIQLEFIQGLSGLVAIYKRLRM